MKYYNQLTIFSNRARVNTLNNFKKLVVTYFDNTEGSSVSMHLNENETAQKARKSIDLNLNKVHKIIEGSGINTSIYYSPPPAVGGLTGNLDVFLNFFNTHRYEILPRDIISFIDRAIGIYEDDKIFAFLRTINPFYWINRIFTYIARLPFYIMGNLGFNQNKIEDNIIGKSIKGALYLVQAGASLLAILEKLDYLDNFKTFIGL